MTSGTARQLTDGMSDAAARGHLARVRRAAARGGGRLADFSESELWACVRARWIDRRAADPAFWHMTASDGRFDEGLAADVIRASRARAGLPGSAARLTPEELGAFLDLTPAAV